MTGRVIEAEELAELNRLGVHHVVGNGTRVRTSQAFRTSEWDYVTEADLQGARDAYAERLADVQRQIATGIIKGATARRALRLAESAVRRSERATLETNYPTDEGDGSEIDPLGAYLVRTVAESIDRPTAEQVIIASRNPMGATSWSMRLENLGTRLLHAHGIKTTARPDVWSRRHNTHLAMADRTAYKGQVRYVEPLPCRTGALGNEPAELGNVITHAVELLVVPRRHIVAGQWVPNTGRVRTAWRGHRKITVTLSERKSVGRSTARKATAAERADRVAALKVGKRGPAVDPWNLASRSLLAAVKRDERTAATAATIESVMRTGRFGSSLTFSDGTIATLSDVSLSTVVYRDVAMPVRELARRAALAGLDID